MLHTVSLTKQYGKQVALSDLNITVQKGEIFAMLGQNGAGKTTTINCFLGFTRPTSGHAFIGGLDVQVEPVNTKKMLAYLPETVMLYPNLSGLENLHFFASLAGFRYGDDVLGNFLQRAGLDSAAFRKRVGLFSKGMRQKVGIAIALAKNAQVLLLDEPTSGLDPKAANEFSNLLLELQADGMTVLMATHDIFRAKDVATTIGIMKGGVLVNLIDNSTGLQARELEDMYLQTV